MRAPIVSCSSSGSSVAGTVRELKGSFLSVGFAAIGNRFVFEINGLRWSVVMDERIPFGSPGIGTNAPDRAYFKDIEVFVPEIWAD
jgi:hypothetical protein